MIVAFDSNVWVSALATRGICADLVRLALRQHIEGRIALSISDAIEEETLRILRQKFHAPPELLDLTRQTLALPRRVTPVAWQPPADFPDPNDVSVIATALTAGADWFVTGDKALLELHRVEGLSLVSPRTAYLRLRGLG